MLCIQVGNSCHTQQMLCLFLDLSNTLSLSAAVKHPMQWQASVIPVSAFTAVWCDPYRMFMDSDQLLKGSSGTPHTE